MTSRDHTTRFAFLLASLLFWTLTASLAAAAPPEPWHLGPAWSVERVRTELRPGQTVTVEGRVVSVRDSRLFTIEDEAGDRIVVVIPNHVQRDSGKPESGENIRVRGKYDHKTFIDTRHKERGKPEKTWGIRVSELARNVETSGRNPDLPDATPVKPRSMPRAKEAPAAPEGLVTIGTPNTPAALKDQLGAARQRALKARKDLESANAALARAESGAVPKSERAAVAQRQTRAQQEYEEALAAIPPLVEQAREAGVDPKALELYEAGLTKPPR